MTQILSLSLWLALVVGAYAQAQVTQPLITLPDGRTVRSSAILADSPSTDWIVYIPGSGSSFKSAGDSERLGLLGSLLGKVNFLVLGKPGVYPTRTYQSRFEASFRRSTRIQDNLEIMKQLIPATDSIYLVGYSEGAYLAPEMAVKDARIRAVSLIAGGTRGWTTEEINKASPQKREEVVNQVARMLANPRSDREWEGMSWATWASYSGNESIQALSRLYQIPVLSIQGDADTMIDVKTAIADTRQLIEDGNPIQLHIIEGADHFFEKDWFEVHSVIRKFTKEQLKLKLDDCIPRAL